MGLSRQKHWLTQCLIVNDKRIFLQKPANTPIIQLIVAWGQSVLTPYFILDTGFSGNLKVNPKTAQELGLNPSGVQNITIANGQIVQAPVAIGYVAIEGAVNLVTILIVDGSHLAGIGLFTKFGYKVTVDCKYRSVELEKV